MNKLMVIILISLLFSGRQVFADLNKLRGNFEFVNLGNTLSIKFANRGPRYSYEVYKVLDKKKEITKEGISEYSQIISVPWSESLYLKARHYRLLISPFKNLSCKLKAQLKNSGLNQNNSRLFFHIRDLRTFNKNDYTQVGILYLNKSEMTENEVSRFRNFKSDMKLYVSSDLESDGECNGEAIKDVSEIDSENEEKFIVRENKDSFEITIPKSLNRLVMNYLNN